MNNTMEYKGYVGSVEFSEEDALFFGKVMGIRALVSYEGKNAQDLVEGFHGAVDDYLTLCETEGTEPEKAYKGGFNVRISPELHKAAVIAALHNQMSLNNFVEDAIANTISNYEGNSDEDNETSQCSKFEIFIDKAGEFRFRLKTRNGVIIATSESYKARASCLNGIKSVKRIAPRAPIVKNY